MKILITMPEDRENSKEDYFAIKNNLGGGDHECWSEELKSMGHEVYYVNWDTFNGETFTEAFSYNEQKFVGQIDVSNFKIAFVYKQEGFLKSLDRFYEMIHKLLDYGIRIINDPKTIKMNISKDYLFNLAKRGLRVIPTYEISEDLKERINDGKELIIKPKIGERGNEIKKIDKVEDFLKVVENKENYLAQDFIPEISNGEKSLAFVGKTFSHAVIKIPNSEEGGGFLCNKSVGGIVNSYNPSEEEIAFSVKVLETFESMGFPVHFSRIDIATDDKGPLLVEAELLNPSIFANDSGKGKEFGKKFANYLNNLLEQ